LIAGAIPAASPPPLLAAINPALTNSIILPKAQRSRQPEPSDPSSTETRLVPGVITNVPASLAAT
jgi:hypothetical protein